MKTIRVMVFAMLVGGSAVSFSAEKREPQDHLICKAGIAIVMGRSPSIMKAKDAGNSIVAVSYVRKDDGTVWSYKCKIQGNVIVWGASDGRWRTDPLDGVVTYKIEKDYIVVSEKYSDGSESVERYRLGSRRR